MKCAYFLILASCLLFASASEAQSEQSDDASSTGAAVLPDSPGVSKPSEVPDAYAGESSSKETLLPAPVQDAGTPAPSTKIQWKPMLVQTAEFTVFQHAWRAAWDPGLRYLLAHKPFWHDYGVSLTDYHMDHWSDGDSFIVNDVGHPLEGAVYGRLFLQNDPRSFEQIGLHNGYWTSRLQSLAWMTLWSTQFEIGPLSETNIGNQGGYYYSIGCGTYKWCLTTPPWSAGANKYTGLGGVTNNTGWTDFVITPIVGLGWVLAEDTLDRYIVTPVAREHRILGGRVLRSALEPTRSLAALFAGKFPWMLPAPENNFVVHPRPKPPKTKNPNEQPLQHYSLASQYTNISLPVIKSGCATACRENLSGGGFGFGYSFTRGFAFDSAVNFLPGQGGTQRMMQGLFGVKLGQRWNRWGLFGKVRPGFIYYNEAWPGGGATAPAIISRFAWDFGGVAEVYTHHNGTLRLDVGTTLVRYLTNRDDTRFTEIGGVISNQYYVNQGNFQISTGYTYRF
jgi:hypothetical protein